MAGVLFHRSSRIVFNVLMKETLAKILDYFVLFLLILVFFLAAGGCSPIIDEDVNVVCIEIYDPVCVDGVTYSNECYASIAGYSNDELIKGECNE